MQQPSIPTDPSELTRRVLAQNKELMRAAAALADAIAPLRSHAQHSSNPNPPRALITGGFVRDALLGARPKDLDMQIFGVSPRETERLVHDVFGGRVARVGKQFEILKVSVRPGVAIDVSLPRRGSGDVFSSHDSGDPTISPLNAALLRDFTVNSMAADPITGEILDPCGGIADLHARVLRIMNPAHFVTRGLHVYRAVQMSARLEFELEAAALPCLRSMVASDLLSRLNARVVTDELKKLLLKAKTLTHALRLMAESGLISRYYPELATALVGVDIAAWIKSCEEVRAATETRALETPERLGVRLASLLYPLRLAHGETLREPTLAALSRLDFGAQTGAAVVGYLTTLHKMESLQSELPGPPSATPPRGKIARFHVPRTAPRSEAPRSPSLGVATASLYPGTANGVAALVRTLLQRPDLAEHLEAYSSQGSQRTLPAPLIDRIDLMKTFQLPSGPELGYLIGKVERHRYELVTREAAIAFLKAHLDEFLLEARAKLFSNP